MAKKKKITFADKANQIESRYYKTRKPGEDDMSDEAYNREMTALMQQQESMKEAEGVEKQQQFAKGGNLPKYQGGGGLSNPTQLTLGRRELPTQNGGNGNGWFSNLFGGGSGDEDKQFMPRANIFGPALSIGANAISNRILRKGAEDQITRLKDLVGVDLGRVEAQSIDLGRERATIRSGQALTEAGGRYVARGARSASEAANIRNQARLGGQRISGDLLSRSLQTEEMTNMQMRTSANEQNRALAAEEATREQEQLMAIERQYGGIDTQLRSGFAKSTAKSLQNYMDENEEMRMDLLKMRIENPNMNLDYREEYDKQGGFGKIMSQLGIKQLNPRLNIR